MTSKRMRNRQRSDSLVRPQQSPTDGIDGISRKVHDYHRERLAIRFDQIFDLHIDGGVENSARLDGHGVAAKIVERATYVDPHQLAEGMAYVLVNGQPVVADGKFTTALPGKVLRKSR